MKVTKHIHKGWQEYENDRGLQNIPKLFEKYQYIYEHKGIKISLVEFADYLYKGENWEIYQIEGSPSLFEDVERFPTKEQAEQRIQQLFLLCKHNIPVDEECTRCHIKEDHLLLD